MFNMDTLIKWKDGTQNVVSSKELIILGKSKMVKTNAKVKMWYSGRWYFGKIMAVEEKLEDDDSEDDLPLSRFRNICGKDWNCRGTSKCSAKR